MHALQLMWTVGHTVSPQSVVHSPPTLLLFYTKSVVRSPSSANFILYWPRCLRCNLFQRILLLPKWPSFWGYIYIYIYIYNVYRIERGKCSANLKPTGIVLKWRKYGTQTLARYQEDKVSHFWSIHALYFRLKNTFVNYHTNPYNLRHCVTLIVTWQYKGQTKVF